MPIFVGNAPVPCIYIGGQLVTAIYLGTNPAPVYEGTCPPCCAYDGYDSTSSANNSQTIETYVPAIDQLDDDILRQLLYLINEG